EASHGHAPSLSLWSRPHWQRQRFLPRVQNWRSAPAASPACRGNGSCCNDTLVGSTELQDEFASTSPAAIAAQWNETLLDHPRTYLSVRARVFAWLFFTPDPVQCDAYYTGLDGPPQYLRELGLAKRFRAQDRALADYGAHFVRTPVFSHVT